MEDPMLIKNAAVFIDGTFQYVDVRTKEDRIIEIRNSMEGNDIIDGSGKLLLPGFIDIHSHGCVGYDFSTATPEEIEKMCEFYASLGITSILATTMTEEYTLLQRAMGNINAAILKENKGARILGINMEGPYLGCDKKGAHDANYLLPISYTTFEELDELSGNHIRMIDLDPKLDGALHFIKKYQNKKIISLAHTSCNYDLACEAFQAGANHITHLFNAMNGLHHREPSLIGALSDFDVFAELIADGIHIHPSVIRMMFKLDKKKMVLISDSMSASGLEDGTYELGGQKVYVKNKKATLEDGTIAGSTTNVYEAIKNCIHFGVTLEDAILSATLLPAKSIKADQEVGDIKVGKKADFVLTDMDLNIKRVFINGEAYNTNRF